MLKTYLVASAIALAASFVFGVVGPYPVFHTTPSVNVVRVDQLEAYQNYLRQSQAGTWDQAKVAPLAPQPLRLLLYTGVNGWNLAISGLIAIATSTVTTVGLMQMVASVRWPSWRHNRLDSKAQVQPKLDAFDRERVA